MTTLSACCHLLPNRGIVGQRYSGAVEKGNEAVLKFFCEFECHRRSLGRKAPILMLYYTQDDSIELQQLRLGTCSQEAFADWHAFHTTLMRRQRVAKPTWQSPVKAEAGGLRPCRPTEGFYHWSDIAVGRPIQMYGFHLLVSEADPATTAFFVGQDPAPLLHHEPASAGISPNSLTRSASTLPTRFLNYTARGTPAMRFTASMVCAPNFGCTECDTKRHFILSFYVEDHSLSISEPPNKDTLTGGECFFPRQHALKPCLQSPYSTDGAYEHNDLYLGALVPVLLRARRGFEAEGPKMFQLLTADDWTLDFMAARPQDWACADEVKVLDKLRQELAVTGRAAKAAQLLAADCSTTAEEQSRSLCVMLTTSGCQVILHECVTLLRHLSGGQTVMVPPSSIAALLHLPEAATQRTAHQHTTTRPQSMRPRAGDLKHQLATTAVQALPRPHTAIGTQRLPNKSRQTGKEGTSYGADFSSTIASARPMHRIGAFVFGNDPENDAYYNRTEHGTYLIREALDQNPGKSPSWA